MNYLELCQDLMREAGIAGAITSVVNQTGELQRVVKWIGKAYTYIQNEHDNWEFLREAVTVDVNPLNATYSAAALGVAGFGEWRFIGNDWRVWNKDMGRVDEQPLRYVPHDAFRRHYDYGASALVPGRPQVVTQLPDQRLQFWPQPDAAYTVAGEHFHAPYILAANEDVPVFAARFHDVIVQRALMLYAEFEEAATMFAAAQSECMRILGQMNDAYLPEWSTCVEPLA